MKFMKNLSGLLSAALLLPLVAPALPAAEVSAPVSVKIEASARREQGPPLGDQVVPAGERMREVVALRGTVTVDGTVDRDAVSILGSTRVGEEGRVLGSAVAVLGRVEARGLIGRDVVAVLGGIEINGPVGGDVVAVLGDVKLGPKAVIQGDLVRVGGSLQREAGAVVRGSEVGIGLPVGLSADGGFGAWVRRCVFLARPLAWDASVIWAWGIAFVFLALYLLIALVFRRAVHACADTLAGRPGLTALGSLLAVFLTPVAFVLLSVSIVGLLVVPFLGLAVVGATLLGKVAVLLWLGRACLRGNRGAPLLAVLVGGLLVLVLYTVPVVGFIVFKLLGWIGLGAVVTTLARMARRNRAPSSPPPISPAPAAAAPLSPSAMATPPAVPLAAPPPLETSASVTSPAFPSPALSPEPVSPPPVASSLPLSPVPPAPRARLTRRLGALAIDALLVGMVLSLLGNLRRHGVAVDFGGGGLLLALAVYGAVLWKLRGATVGGIVCGLQVVRSDSRAMDWATVIVRALACFLSLAPLGLGFLWAAFDADKQTWHDKIAGTVVIRPPKPAPLV
jgi:uncharacterized RDD family membrane protein YckC